MVIVQNDVNMRNISDKKMYRKLLNIIIALLPMLKYSVPTRKAMQVCMVNRVKANDLSRRKLSNVRIISKYHWRKKVVA